MKDIDTLDRLAARQAGVVTFSQLIELGATPRQIRRWREAGIMVTIHERVYRLVGTARGWHQSVAAATLAGAPLCAASVRSAARLWGLRTVDDEVEISIRYPRKLTLDGVVVHQSRDLTETDITWVDGIATTTPRRTLCDLGLIFPESEVMRMACHAVATGLVTEGELIEIRRRLGKQGRNGVGVLDECITRLPAGARLTESGIEVMFLELCRNYAILTPSIQLPVRVGGQNYRLDFAYPTHRIMIEIDGASTHSGLTQIAADGGRQNDLVAAGWQPLRFTYEMLRDQPDACASVVRRALEGGAENGGPLRGQNQENGGPLKGQNQEGG